MKVDIDRNVHIFNISYYLLHDGGVIIYFTMAEIGFVFSIEFLKPV